MSHLTRICTQIKDKTMLEKSLKDLGYTTSKNAYIKEYNGKKHMVEIALSDRVGFQKSGQVFEFIGDMMYFRENKERFMGKVTQKYAQNKVMSMARSKGYLTSQSVLSDGTIKLNLRRAMA